MKTYYYLDENNAVLGPVDLGTLETMLNKETITAETMVCIAGEQEWCRLRELLKPIKSPINDKPSSAESKINPLRSMREKSELLAAKFFLAIITALLILIVVLMWPSKKEYEYAAFRVSRELMDNTYVPWGTEYVDGSYKKGKRVGDVTLECVTLSKTSAINKWVLDEDKKATLFCDADDWEKFFEWEYVGPLCNDGVNATWILVRRIKK